jgi:hypothetical protein
VELKPTGKVGWDPEGKKGPKPLESIGAGGDNPWEVVNRGAVGAPAAKRRNWGRASLGATPPRDGPFQASASGIAGLMPPKTRTRRQAASPWELLNDGKRR